MIGLIDYALLLTQYMVLMLPFLKIWLKWVQRALEPNKEIKDLDGEKTSIKK